MTLMKSIGGSDGGLCSTVHRTACNCGCNSTFAVGIAPRESFQKRECYYPSVKVENKGLLALFSVRQGRRVDLLLDRLGFSVTCTMITVALLTGIQDYRLH